MYGAPKEVNPIFTGCFTFDSPDMGNVVLEVEFSKHLGSEYERTRAQWIKKDMVEATTPLNINLIQLEGLVLRKILSVLTDTTQRMRLQRTGPA